MKHVFLSMLIFSFLLSACAATKPATPSAATIIPSIEHICKSTIDWQGLVPGQSNKKDVIRILGNPSKKGKISFEDRKISYYAYDVSGGVIADHAQDRIFFREDGVIDWMELIQADRTDRVETVLDVVSQLGNELDVVFPNNNFRPGVTFYDVFNGPTRIYVWSECGVAVEALPSYEALSFGTIETGCQSGNLSPEMCTLSFRHKYLPYADNNPHYDVNSIILMKFYFRSTSYQGFTEYFMFKIPFRTWGEYLDELGR